MWRLQSITNFSSRYLSDLIPLKRSLVGTLRRFLCSSLVLKIHFLRYRLHGCARTLVFAHALHLSWSCQGLYTFLHQPPVEQLSHQRIHSLNQGLAICSDASVASLFNGYTRGIYTVHKFIYFSPNLLQVVSGSFLTLTNPPQFHNFGTNCSFAQPSLLPKLRLIQQ